MFVNRRHIMLLAVGNLLLAMASSWFLLPSHVISGGVNGIAVILEKVFNLEPMMVINILIIACFLLGVLFLGREFAVKTAASTLLYPLFLQLIAFISLPVLPQLAASIIGGLLTGFGIGLIMRSGGCSGGMDVPPLILHKYFNLPVSVLVFICDSFIVFGGLIVYGWLPVLIGLVSVAACSKALNFALQRP